MVNFFIPIHSLMDTNYVYDMCTKIMNASLDCTPNLNRCRGLYLRICGIATVVAVAMAHMHTLPKDGFGGNHMHGVRGMSRTDHGTFQLCCAESMALDVDDIVHPSRDFVMAVLVPVGPVSGEVGAGIRPIVRVQELVVVAVDGPSHGGPRPADAQISRHIVALDFLALHNTSRHHDNREDG